MSNDYEMIMKRVTIMSNENDCHEDVTIHERRVEKVAEFTHLGRKVTSDGRSKREVMNRKIG